MRRYEISRDRLLGAAQVALEVLGFDGTAEVLTEHCPAGATPSVASVVDRTACLRAILDAVRGGPLTDAARLGPTQGQQS